MLIMNKIVGNNLKKIRKAKSISQEQAADNLHISQSAYARIERGESNSWANHLIKICEFFGINPQEILKNETEHNKEDENNLNGNFIINQLSDRMIEQYEARIKELKKVIKDLKKERKS